MGNAELEAGRSEFKEEKCLEGLQYFMPLPCEEDCLNRVILPKPNDSTNSTRSTQLFESAAPFIPEERQALPRPLGSHPSASRSYSSEELKKASRLPPSPNKVALPNPQYESLSLSLSNHHSATEPPFSKKPLLGPNHQPPTPPIHPAFSHFFPSTS